MVDGTTGTLTINSATAGATVLTFASDAGTSILNMEVGASGDAIVLGGGLQMAVGGNCAVNLTGLGGLYGATQNLIFAPGGLSSGSFSSFTPFVPSGNFDGFSVSLSSDLQHLILNEVGGTIPNTAFWNGTVNTSWATYNQPGPITNWVTATTGGIELGATPGPLTSVFFTATAAQAGNFASTTLDTPFSIGSLTFTGTGTSAATALTIGPGSANAANSLTIGGGGLTVSSGSGNHTLSAPVILNTNQSWTIVDAGNVFTASGGLSGNCNFVKAGNGTLLLTGPNAFIGTTSINAGTLQLNAGGSLAAGNAVTVGAVGALTGSGTVGGALTANAGALLAPGINPIGNFGGIGTLTLASATPPAAPC